MCYGHVKSAVHGHFKSLVSVAKDRLGQRKSRAAKSHSELQPEQESRLLEPALVTLACCTCARYLVGRSPIQSAADQIARASSRDIRGNSAQQLIKNGIEKALVIKSFDFGDGYLVANTFLRIAFPLAIPPARLFPSFLPRLFLFLSLPSSLFVSARQNFLVATNRLLALRCFL